MSGVQRWAFRNRFGNVRAMGIDRGKSLQGKVRDGHVACERQVSKPEHFVNRPPERHSLLPGCAAFLSPALHTGSGGHSDPPHGLIVAANVTATQGSTPANLPQTSNTAAGRMAGWADVLGDDPGGRRTRRRSRGCGEWGRSDKRSYVPYEPSLASPTRRSVTRPSCITHTTLSRRSCKLVGSRSV